MSLLERGNTRLAPLDTVEPDWYGNANSLGERHTALVARWKGHGTLGLYSRETVESLLAQCRKEALLEAAERCVRLTQAAHEFERPSGFTCARELRRMAESTMEGEK